MKPYPSLQDRSANGMADMLQYISRQRESDILDWNNLPSIYMSGRKVGKIPADSDDVADSDRVGDFNYDADYMYLLVNDSGSAKWRRITLGVW